MKFVKFIDVNPKTLIIFDDYLTISRAVEPSIQELFVQGRHYGITTIVSTQAYMTVNNVAWMGAFCTIFTQQMQYNEFINKDRKNNYSPSDKKLMKSYVGETFEDLEYTVVIHD